MQSISFKKRPGFSGIEILILLAILIVFALVILAYVNKGPGMIGDLPKKEIWTKYFSDALGGG